MSGSSNSKIYRVIGLMSGTSLDGLDIAYCHFIEKDGVWQFSIKQTESIEYDQVFKNKLKECVNLNSEKLLSFHNQYGSWLGEVTKKFITSHQLEVDFISSHGHTIFHQPQIGFTYQIGSGQHLANNSGYKTICDFRTNDVALGGQGAPLVPIGDSFLFSEYDFCLNLGGFSNISFNQNNLRIAYDISPANMLLNLISKKIDKEYDSGGQIARTGNLDETLLDKLNALPYYTMSHPKSLGYEWFINTIVPIINDSQNTVEDLLHTSVIHIAEQISKAIIKTGQGNAKVLVTGGGAKNDFLVEQLQKKLGTSTQVVIPNLEIIDFKEALIFAFMGVLKDRKEINCLRSVTGAFRDSSSGVIYHPS